MSNSFAIFTDGGARGNPGPAGIGVHVVDVDSKKVVYEHKDFVGHQTNNIAEYMALHSALVWLSRFCTTTKVRGVDFYLDSKLVVEQVNGAWKVRDPHLLTWWKKITQLTSGLPCKFSLSYVPREQNKAADRLVNQALDQAVL